MLIYSHSMLGGFDLKKFFETLRRSVVYILSDFAMLVLSLFLATVIDAGFNSQSVIQTLRWLPETLVLMYFVYACFSMYGTLWKYAGARECILILAANAVTGSALFLVFFIMKGRGETALSANRILWIVVFMTILSFTIRMLSRTIEYLKHRIHNENNEASVESRIMIIGAGGAADALIRELSRDNKLSTVKCIIDDNPAKVGTYLHGVRVVGNRSLITEAVNKYKINEIIFAIPSMSRTERAKLLEECNRNCKSVKSVPSMSELVNDEVKLSSLREINVEDLLGREPIKTNLDDIMSYVSGKVVLVTGGGGSIGSELCRQIASYSPKKLVIVDIYENNAYDIQQELLRNHPELDLSVEIASVRDTQRLYNIFDRYRPNLVYHAAAHKHVPLMENNPHEAIKNNVFGTLKTVMAASTYGVDRFVMISTDKAVNPTNIMGATKRICEMIVQSYNKRSKTEFVAVRFGNVLGSNGSVIPLFMKQIQKGGPVTVTHPDIIRFFMTIPEAVSLVLQAGAIAKGGEIFVLNMGKPVKILELAENVIRLSGHIPYDEIPIEFTGLRPGEKLYEELLMSEEGLKETDNKLIFIGKPIDFDDEYLFNKLSELSNALGDETSDVRKIVAEIVTTYKYKVENDKTC